MRVSQLLLGCPQRPATVSQLRVRIVKLSVKVGQLESQVPDLSLVLIWLASFEGQEDRLLNLDGDSDSLWPCNNANCSANQNAQV